ncbi:MAG: septum formation initiator family protein [Clostridiales bacterium]|nr:septum formation initiator family protein [Clostridiales bacterium]
MNKKNNKAKNNNKKLSKWLLIIAVVYVAYIFISQQVTLGKYSTEAAYYKQMKQNEQERNTTLLEQKENVNSDKFIEKMAREELGLVMPNETIYVDSTRY